MTTPPNACTDDAYSARRAQAERDRRELQLRVDRAAIARKSFPDFAQQAIAAGVVDGIKRVRWGRHLDAYCASLQFQLEGWIVSYGPGRDSEEWPAWESEHAEMIARQREAWDRTGATWEDGEPDPWLRYVLVQNEVDNLPPATLKSTLAMVLANAWIWLWEPTFAFAALSGMDGNVDRDSKATRELVKSRWYRETFQIAWQTHALEDGSTVAARAAQRLADEELNVKRDSDAVSDWATTAGGKRRSRTLNAGLTGSHSDGIFLDDPDDADKVWGEADRVRPQNRWTRAAENRINDENRSIRRVLQQRVHPEDFTFYLLSVGRWSPERPRGWVWFCLAAEYGYQPEDAPASTPYGPIDWRTDKGDTLHAALSPGVLAHARTRNLSGYEGQYNQNPARESNGILARRFARFFVFEEEKDRVHMLRRRPDGCPTREQQPPIVVRRADLKHRTLSVDANNTLDLKPGAKPSAVGLTVDAMLHTGETLVLDDRTKVLDINGTYQAIFDALRVWPLDVILVEIKAAGPSVVNELRNVIRRGWYIDPVTDKRTDLLGPDGKPTRPEIKLANPKEGKPARNQGLVQPWQSGLILLHDGAHWLDAQIDAGRRTIDEGFIGEVSSWPGSRRGDRMDSLSQYVASHRVVVVPKVSAPPIVLTRAP